MIAEVQDVPIGVWVAFSGFLIETLFLIGSAIWAVAKIKATTDTLGARIDSTATQLNTSLLHLEKTLDKLESSIDRFRDRLADHDRRIARVEGQQNQPESP